MKYVKPWRRALYSVFVVLSLLIFNVSTFAGGLNQLYGYNIQNSGSLPSGNLINTSNVANLQMTDLAAGLNAGHFDMVPTIVGNILYATDTKGYTLDANGYPQLDASGGNLYAFNIQTKQLVWKKNFVNDYPSLGGKFIVSFNSPTVAGNYLILGNNYPGPTSPNSQFMPSKYGAMIIAVNQSDGSLAWSTVVDDQPTAIITSSPLVFGNTIYVGISSDESGVGAAPDKDPSIGYKCCTFRGSVVALNKNTGEILWRHWNLPVNTANSEQDWHNRATGGYTNPDGSINMFGSLSGGSVWGAGMSVDPSRNQLYYATGQIHMLPLAYPANQTPAGMASDSVIAVDMSTGALKWQRNFGPGPGNLDIWNESCIAQALVPISIFFGHQQPAPNNPNSYQQYCRIQDFIDYSSSITAQAAINDYLADPTNTTKFFTALIDVFTLFNSPNTSATYDRDFSMGPTFINGVKMSDGSVQDMVVAMQKMGIIYALNPDTGVIIWQTTVAQQSAAGSRGIATDGKTIYIPAFNTLHFPFTLINGQTVYGGYFTAVDAATGKILWETPTIDHQADLLGAVALANGILYGADQNTSGTSTMYALDASNGNILATFSAGGDAINQQWALSRPTIINGNIFWGTGYRHPSNTPYGSSESANVGHLFMFSLPGS